MSGGARLHEVNIVIFLLAVLAASIIYGAIRGLIFLLKRGRQ